MNQLIIQTDMPFKTLESKETKAQREKTVTHNSVFAATSTQNAVPRLRDGIFLFWETEPRITRIKRIFGGSRA